MFVERSVTLQRPRQAEALQGQRLVESLPDGPRRAGVVTLLHQGLQDLQPGRDAQAMKRFPDPVHHAEHR